MHRSLAQRWWVLWFCWVAGLGMFNLAWAVPDCADALTPPSTSNYALAGDIDFGRQAYQILRREFAYRIATTENYAYHLARDGQISQVIQRYASKLAMLEFFRTTEGKELRSYLGRKLQKQILHDLRSFYPLYLKELAKRLPPLGSAPWRYQEIVWHGKTLPALVVTIDETWESRNPQIYAAVPAMQKLDQLAGQIKQLWQNAQLPGKVNLAVTHRGLWNDPAVKNLADLLRETPEGKVRVENGTFYLPWFIFEDIPETTKALAGSLEHYRLDGLRFNIDDGRQSYNFAAIDALWNQVKQRELNPENSLAKISAADLAFTLNTPLAEQLGPPQARLNSMYERWVLATHLDQALRYMDEAIQAVASPQRKADLGVQLAYHPYPFPDEDVRQLWRGPGYVALSFTGHSLGPESLPLAELVTTLASVQIQIPVLAQPAPGQAHKAWAAQIAQDIMQDISAWALAALQAEQQRLQALAKAVAELGPLPQKAFLETR